MWCVVGVVRHLKCEGIVTGLGLRKTAQTPYCFATPNAAENGKSGREIKTSMDQEKCPEKIPCYACGRKFGHLRTCPIPGMQSLMERRFRENETKFWIWWRSWDGTKMDL